MLANSNGLTLSAERKEEFLQWTLCLQLSTQFVLGFKDLRPSTSFLWIAMGYKSVFDAAERVKKCISPLTVGAVIQVDTAALSEKVTASLWLVKGCAEADTRGKGDAAVVGMLGGQTAPQISCSNSSRVSTFDQTDCKVVSVLIAAELTELSIYRWLLNYKLSSTLLNNVNSIAEVCNPPQQYPPVFVVLRIHDGATQWACVLQSGPTFFSLCLFISW